jgi:hypothetical protein
MQNKTPRTRSKIVPIRYPTQSRKNIVIIVAQSQNAMGKWLVPVITFEGPVDPFLESGRYARDFGVAWIIAAYWYEIYMLDVKKDYLGEDING